MTDLDDAQRQRELEDAQRQRELSRRIWRARWWRFERYLARTLVLWTALAAGIWAMYQHFQDRDRSSQDQRRAAATALLDAQKPFLQLQLKTYEDFLARLADLLTFARHDNGPSGPVESWEKEQEFSKLLSEFFKIYRTRLPLIEHPSIAAAKNEMIKKLDLYSAARINSRDALIDRNRKHDELKAASEKLANAIRDAIQDSWRTTSGI